VKVNDLQRQLDEGFLDNLVSKVQSMAGGDGPTGIIRALRGQDAALRKFADAITNATRNKVMQRVGNQLDLINSGKAPLPVTMIYQQAISAAKQVAASDQMNVDVGQVGQTIRSNRADIERLVLSSNVGDNNQIKLIFDSILGGTGSSNIGMEVEPAMKAVSMIVAGAIIYIKTTKEDLEDYNIEPADLESFNAAGEQVKEILCDPTSAEIRALQPNEDFKDHLHWLIIQMIQGIQKKYAVLDNAKLQALLANPPALISPLEFKTALSGHSASVDPDAVNQLIAKATPAIQNQFKIWLEIAVKETAAGGPPNQSSHLYVEPWGASAMVLVDKMKFGTPAKKEAPQVSPDAEEEIQSLTDSHTAGETALRNALATNPNLTPVQMKDVYDKAREAYNNANPTT